MAEMHNELVFGPDPPRAGERYVIMGAHGSKEEIDPNDLWQFMGDAMQYTPPPEEPVLGRQIDPAEGGLHYPANTPPYLYDPYPDTNQQGEQ